MMDDSYIAGFFDADGSVGRYGCHATKNGRVYFRLQVQFTNTNREVLAQIQESLNLGGGLYGHTRNHPRYSNCYKLIYQSRGRAAAVIERLLPHLVLKKKRAADALQAEQEARKTGR